jgi:hypothetical protein
MQLIKYAFSVIHDDGEADGDMYKYAGFQHTMFTGSAYRQFPAPDPSRSSESYLFPTCMYFVLFY